MSLSILLMQQIIIMFLLAGVGYLLFKGGKISQEGSKSLGNILIYVVLPCVIVNSFLVERTPERLRDLLISTVLALIILIICITASRLAFPKDAIAIFGATHSNPGFFGIPLIAACLPAGSVFYVASFIGFLNLLQWTYGVSIMTGTKGTITLKKLFHAPFFLAILIGLALFLTQLPLPSLVTRTMSFITGINTPLAMFTVGIYLAQTDMKAMFRRISNYQIAAVRLVLIPLIAAAVLFLFPSTNVDMKTALLIAAACPVGSNIAVYAQLHNQDYPYAVETVIISSLLSVITIPLIVSIGNFYF